MKKEKAKYLYHGTSDKFLASIKANGFKNYTHFALHPGTAYVEAQNTVFGDTGKEGLKHPQGGNPIILVVEIAKLSEENQIRVENLEGEASYFYGYDEIILNHVPSSAIAKITKIDKKPRIRSRVWRNKYPYKTYKMTVGSTFKSKLLIRTAGAEAELFSLLKDSGSVLIRNKNHFVYKLPDGKNFVISKTPSDGRARDNELLRLKRFLGRDIMEKLRPSQYKKTQPENEEKPLPVAREGLLSPNGGFELNEKLSKEEAIENGYVRFVIPPQGKRLFLQFGPKAIGTVKEIIRDKKFQYEMVGLEFTAGNKQTYRSFEDNNEALIFLNKLQKYKQAFASKLLLVEAENFIPGGFIYC